MAVLATDDFNRADNADLGADWTPQQDGTNGGDNFEIVSNTAKSPEANDSCEQQVTATWPNDQWSEATLFNTNNSGQGAGSGVALRCAAVGTRTYYRFCANASGWTLGRLVGGTHTEIIGGTGTVWAAGDRVYLEVQGTTLVAKKNTTAGAGGTTVTTQTDANIASGRAGIAHSTSDVDAAIDVWQGGDFAGAAAGPSPQRLTVLGVS